MEFEPGKYLSSDVPSPNVELAGLIILNQPISTFSTFKRIWNHTNHRICADGGANRLYDIFSDLEEEHRDQYLPDLIIGDLDSLRLDVRRYYESQGVQIFEDGDQYSTDFGKSMKALTGGYPKLSLISESGSQQDIIIKGTISGRVDQGIGLLHELYRETMNRSGSSGTHSGIRLWLISEQSVSSLLRPGQNVILGVDQKDDIFTPNIGILPIFGPAVITTKGLEWDVEDWKTEMGGMVSTSNHIMHDKVEVQTDVVVLFTIEMKERLK
ncbi:thiamine pyrophosphokinase-like protein 1 [Tothia fuscella]|uniref:Thiamine pyrophosphokinase n=1 Tax=Tothia fuscella TaxID=1048955 RepID=A0A9P4P0V1_9PEZI|nr:thiamine pyrophosphokinase-like protein 1 [Tothia fuscella]